MFGRIRLGEENKNTKKEQRPGVKKPVKKAIRPLHRSIDKLYFLFHFESLAANHITVHINFDGVNS